MQDKVEMNPLEIVQGQLPEIVNLDSKSETDSNAINNASKMKNEVKNVINNSVSSSLMLETAEDQGLSKSIVENPFESDANEDKQHCKESDSKMEIGQESFDEKNPENDREIMALSEKSPVEIDAKVDSKMENDQETEILMNVEDAEKTDKDPEIISKSEKSPLEIDSTVEKSVEKKDSKDETEFTENKSEIISKSENFPVEIDTNVEKPEKEIDSKKEKDREIQEITPITEKTPLEIDTNVEKPNEEIDSKKENVQEIEDLMEVENAKETENNSEIIPEKTPVEIDINMEKPNEEMESKKENTTSQESEELVTKIDKVQNTLEKDPEIITKSDNAALDEIDENKDQQKGDLKSSKNTENNSEILKTDDKSNGSTKTINNSLDVFSSLLEVSSTTFDEKKHDDNKNQDFDEEEDECSDTEIDKNTHETQPEEGKNDTENAKSNSVDSPDVFSTLLEASSTSFDEKNQDSNEEIDNTNQETHQKEGENDLDLSTSGEKVNKQLASGHDTENEKSNSVETTEKKDQDNSSSDEKSRENADNLNENNKSKEVTLGSIIETFNIDKNKSKKTENEKNIETETEVIKETNSNCVTLDESEDEEILRPTSAKRPRILEDEESDEVGNVTKQITNDDPLCAKNNTKTIPEKQLESTNAETIVIDDEDENNPTIQKIRETEPNVNKQLSTAATSSETDPLAFASSEPETETIIGDIDEDDQISREIMSAFGNADPLNTSEVDKQTAEDSGINSSNNEGANDNDYEDDELIIIDSFHTNNDDFEKENDQNTENDMEFRQSSIALHPIFPDLANNQQTAEDEQPPSKRQRISLFSKSTNEPITPRIILRNNGNFPSITNAKQTASTPNKQLTMPLRRQGNGTLNPQQLSLLVNQQNLSNFLPNTPLPITQLTNANAKTTRYHCDVCPNSFSDMNSLQFHVKKTHEVRSETRKSLTSTVKAEQDVICHNCLRTPAASYILDCGHLPFCDMCSQSILTKVPKKRICPICKTKIKKRLRAYVEMIKFTKSTKAEEEIPEDTINID